MVTEHAFHFISREVAENKRRSLQPQGMHNVPRVVTFRAGRAEPHNSAMRFVENDVNQLIMNVNQKAHYGTQHTHRAKKDPRLEGVALGGSGLLASIQSANHPRQPRQKLNTGHATKTFQPRGRGSRWPWPTCR